VKIPLMRGDWKYILKKNAKKLKITLKKAFF